MLAIPPMTATQLWLTQIPIAITSLATFIIAWTGFRTMQRSQAAAAAAASGAAKAADGAAKAADGAAKAAAVLVAEVKTTLVTTDNHVASKLDKIQQIADDTHVLVNNAMGQQLRMHAQKARQVADLTKDPLDIADAKLAEEALAVHLKKQARVDHAVQARVQADEVKAKPK
jgi:X-X-X-Leu-X-X-Gly heptad repeat protein